MKIKDRYTIVAFRLLFISLSLTAIFSSGAMLSQRILAARIIPPGQEDGEKKLAEQITQSTTIAADSIWQDLTSTELIALKNIAAQARNERLGMLKAFRTLNLNQAALKELMGTAPARFTEVAKNSDVVIALPMPDGTFNRFRLTEAPMLEPKLAAKFPEIKTYEGQGIDDKTATMRFDWTYNGFNAIVLSANHSMVLIEPYQRGNTSHYISYYKRDLNDPRVFKCGVTPEEEAEELKHRLPRNPQVDQIKQYAAPYPSGEKMRFYNLAMAATGEFTQLQGGTIANGLSGIVTLVNQINAIFGREVAVNLTLVDNTNIIFTDPANDPFTNNDIGSMITEVDLMFRFDGLIDMDEFDVGHVVGTMGGGRANIGSVCGFFKGRGASNGTLPVSEVLAHEFGHQFGAHHTFNTELNTKDENDNFISNCNEDNRHSEGAYEPGSGATIMSYSGNCGVQFDYEPISIDYFHAISFEEITDYINNDADDCAVRAFPGNNPPQVSANIGLNTIPRNTPFTLIANGYDPDGDTLTYCWEQFDQRSDALTVPVEVDPGSGPILRSFAPTTSPSRTFPKLETILTGAPSKGEVLPTTNRTLNFRVTARDNRTSGGVDYATAQVNVTASAGPFFVTSPNAPTTWLAGTQQTVTWNVANTNNAPVSCSNVDIYLSTDGGYTFPMALALQTPNTGSATFQLPAYLPAGTDKARIKVEASDNIFFDISDSNFTIEVRADISLSMSVSNNQVTPNSPFTYTITVSNNGPSFARNVEISDILPYQIEVLSCSATGGGVCENYLQIYTTKFSLLTPGETATITINGRIPCSVTSDPFITNTASVIGSSVTDINQSNNSASVPITVFFPLLETTPNSFLIGAENSSYSQNLFGTGGTAPYTITVSSGQLPPGLQLTNNGQGGYLISGTPTQSGIFNFQLKVAESSGCYAILPRSIEIICRSAWVQPDNSYLPNATIGSAYNQTFSVISESQLSYQFTISAGQLPAGLTLNPTTGVLSGTPTQSGDFNFTIRATDTAGCSGSRSYNLHVNCGAITINPNTLAPVTAGTALENHYDQQLSVSSGTAPFNFLLLNGTLPQGLQLSSDGHIFGNAVQTGTFNFTVKVTDNSGCMAYRSYSLPVDCGTIKLMPGAQNSNTQVALGAGTVGANYQQTITANNDTHHNFEVINGALPPGISTSYQQATNSYLLVGTCLQTGIYEFSVKATTSFGCVGTQAYRIVVSGTAPPTISNFTPNNAPVNSQIQIFGSGLLGLTDIRFNGVSAQSFTIISDTQMVAVVPANATTGPISLFNPYGSASSIENFVVQVLTLPVITSFTPTSGPVGTLVTITGSNFTGTFMVSFTSTPANFTVDSDNQITVTVPANATTGYIIIHTNQGSTSSSTQFTVTGN